MTKEEAIGDLITVARKTAMQKATLETFTAIFGEEFYNITLTGTMKYFEGNATEAIFEKFVNVAQTAIESARRAYTCTC
jgi:hypothetical protein